MNLKINEIFYSLEDEGARRLGERLCLAVRLQNQRRLLLVRRALRHKF